MWIFIRSFDLLCSVSTACVLSPLCRFCWCRCFLRCCFSFCAVDSPETILVSGRLRWWCWWWWWWCVESFFVVVTISANGRANAVFFSFSPVCDSPFPHIRWSVKIEIKPFFVLFLSSFWSFIFFCVLAHKNSSFRFGTSFFLDGWLYFIWWLFWILPLIFVAALRFCCCFVSFVQKWIKC